MPSNVTAARTLFSALAELEVLLGVPATIVECPDKAGPVAWAFAFAATTFTQPAVIDHYLLRVYTNPYLYLFLWQHTPHTPTGISLIRTFPSVSAFDRRWLSPRWQPWKRAYVREI